MAGYENWGDFFWPGQLDECRRNIGGLHDPVALERFERKRTAQRAVELRTGKATLPATCDLAHLQAIHHHLFQDVYAWAGQLRPVELVRPSDDPNAPGHEFVKPADLERLAEVTFSLSRPDQLTGLALDDQVARLGQTYAAINVLHPFVEGNGRTQRAYLTSVAGAVGLEIEWKRFADQNQVMAHAFNRGPEIVIEALRGCTQPTPAEHSTGRPIGRAGVPSWPGITSTAAAVGTTPRPNTQHPAGRVAQRLPRPGDRGR